MALVTVVICTYRRPALLEKCLASLAQQTCEPEAFTVLVVDNHGDDDCRSVAIRHGADYVYEPRVGLSHARNRGTAETSTEWVFYLDDDALAHPDMLAQFLSASAHPCVDVVGGRFEHYFATPPPAWLRVYYQEPVRATTQEGLVELHNQEYLSGGVFAARTEIVRRYPFRADLGMVAGVPGYGEETEWQDRLRAAGHTIHYLDDIAIDHLVGPHKQTIASRLAIARAHGQYWARTQTSGDTSTEVPGGNAPPGYTREIVRVLVRTLSYDVARVLFKPGFYWQNGVVSTLGKMAYLRGKYSR